MKMGFGVGGRLDISFETFFCQLIDFIMLSVRKG